MRIAGQTKLVIDLIFPEGATDLGRSCFCGCKSLKSLQLPQNIKNISDECFLGCSGLTGELKLLEGLTNIGQCAFDDCRGLTGELKLPEGLTSIEASAFSGCSGLSSVTIPNADTQIGSQSFYACSKDLIIYGRSGSYADTYASSNGIQFVALPPIIVLDVSDIALFTDAPGNHRTIAWHAEYGDADPEEAVWSSTDENVAAIANGIVTATGIGTATVYATYADERSNEVKVTVGEGSVIKLPKLTEIIDEQAFYGNTAIERIIIPDGTRQIGSQAFASCQNLNYIMIPDSVEAIAEDAFVDCDQLTILCPVDSFAAGFADTQGIDCDLP